MVLYNTYAMVVQVLRARILLAAFGALALVLLIAPAASAHRPEWGTGSGVTRIPDPHTSYAFYRDLRHPEDVHVYSFAGRAGETFHAGINVPAIPGLESYGVTLALLGPGLPILSPATVPASLPPGGTGTLYPSTAGDDFFEPFTQTRYWGRQDINLTIPQNGTYYLAIWHPSGQPGKYVLDTGTIEVFGMSDLFRFPAWWVRVHLYFGHGPYLLAGGALALAASAGFVALAVRRQRRVKSRPKIGALAVPSVRTELRARYASELRRVQQMGSQ
jgi:hypothetical protein